MTLQTIIVLTVSEHHVFIDPYSTSSASAARGILKKNVHGGIQRIPSGVGGPDNVFFYFKSLTYFTEGRTNLTGEAIGPWGPIAPRGGSVPVFLRKPIATCDFPGGSESPFPCLLSIHTRCSRLTFLHCKYQL